MDTSLFSNTLLSACEINLKHPRRVAASSARNSPWAVQIRAASQGVPLSEPFSTRAFMSEYAVLISLLSAAAFVAAPGLSFT